MRLHRCESSCNWRRSISANATLRTFVPGLRVFAIVPQEMEVIHDMSTNAAPNNATGRRETTVVVASDSPRCCKGVKKKANAVLLRTATSLLNYATVAPLHRSPTRLCKQARQSLLPIEKVTLSARVRISN